MIRFSFPIPGLLALSLFLSLLSCGSDAPPEFYRNADFGQTWEFHMGDLTFPLDQASDDGHWIPVDLPHDWSILDYPRQDSLHVGPFFRDLPGGADVGYLRDGIAWYRKEFVTPPNQEDKRIILNFDGVQSQMELWVNDRKLGEHVYGYTPFQFDITSALNGPGEENVIAVKIINPGENSRWFAGAGIYRPVSISVLHGVGVATWGVFVTSPEVSHEKASVEFDIQVSNQLHTDVELSAQIRIISPNSEQMHIPLEGVSISAGSKMVLNATARIEDPMLWSIQHPELYLAEVLIYANGKLTDTYPTHFGIRSIDYNVEEGFLLNGEPILLKGACMHHDNGMLGAAAFRDAEFRRVKQMKENGYNAIRASHNPPSRAFLEACDELGMLLIDEAFDHWVKAKRPNDYSNYFQEWHRKDIQSMVYRDRNHPSVVMWSIGNEVQERADPEGIEIGNALVAAIREVDDTRPITQAVCAFWDNPGKDWDYSAGAFSMLDIGGYNYQFQNYEADHAKHPQRIMYGSESVPQHAWENWELVKRLPYVIGDFVWTGMDYMGESGIGHTRLVDVGEEGRGNFLKPWPWYISWCGDLDILGNKKPQSRYRDVLWDESRLELLVSAPLPDGKESRLSYWGWYDEAPHWNWEGHEGAVMQVKAYSSLDAVRLELNGRNLGVAEIDSLDKYVARFSVPYEAGELRAIGMMGGKETDSVLLKTTGPAAALDLAPEQTGFDAHYNALAFIHVDARDPSGLRNPLSEDEVEVKLSGPARLLAAGNASPEHQGSFTDHSFRLFRGQGLIIIRSTGESGSIQVDVHSPGLDPASVILEAR